MLPVAIDLNAATGMLSVVASISKPAGNSRMESPWLIQTCDAGNQVFKQAIFFLLVQNGTAIFPFIAFFYFATKLFGC